ncbi:MAG TPA: response regulator [Thermoanaerobaculia bacterium]|nr:response regulator [Thermoanaerobaculia bacterium]
MTDTIVTSAGDVERRKRQRYARLVLIELPRLRCIGFAFLSVGVYLNNRFLLGEASLHDWTVVTIVMAAYAAVAWVLQAFLYRRFEIDLTLFFLVADMPVWIVALYFSGAERSWLFFILFMRFADQTQTTFRRCLAFVTFGTLLYAGMLAWVAIVDGRSLDAGAVAAKLAFIFFGGVYIALSALTSESRRKHLAEAMHTTREAIRMLEEQSVELRDARARAEEASAAKSEFLANMSHEMRTPLHGILGMLQLAIDTERSPERVRQLEMARRSAEGLLGTIEGILDFSRIEARRVELEPIYFSIRELVTDTVKALAVSAVEKGLSISFGVNAAVPDRLWGDPTRLRQILVNLLGNAIKFTAAGEVVVRVWCEEREGNDLRVRFEVRDTGIGIDVGKRERIFEPFEQAEGTRSRRFGGTGLGLSIVSGLVTAMGGSIDLESERGKGTVFRFDVVLASDTIAGDVAPEWERSLEGLRVVVVEPNPTARGFIADMLRAHGIVPETYASIDEATQPNIRFAYACVVADRRLLAASGWQPAVPVVRVVSILDPPDDELVAVTRPVGERELIDAIGIALELRERPLPILHSPRIASSRALRVLVVDDHPINHEFAAEALRRLGHTVTTASSGQEALALLEARSFDLVLMDVQMPDLDGLEATRRFRASEQGKHTPVIALTAHSGRDEHDRCVAAGMDDVITKPVTTARLAAVISGAAADAEPRVLDAVGGNVLLLARVRDAFVRQTPRLLAAIREAIDDRNPDAIARNAHTLKGAMSNFTGSDAQSLAAELEQAGKDGNYVRAADLLPRLEAATDELGKKIDAALA